MGSTGKDANLDIAFDATDMILLKGKIDFELEQVRKLLDLVTEECSSTLDEEDTVLHEINEKGQKLVTAWNNLWGGFNTVSTKIGELFNQLQESIKKKQEEAQNMKTSL